MNALPSAPNGGGRSPSLWQRTLRDVVIVAVGVFLLVNEAIGSDPAQPYLVAAGLACFGIPFVLRADERKK